LARIKPTNGMSESTKKTTLSNMAMRAKSTRRAGKGGRPEMSPAGFGANVGRVAEGSYFGMDMQVARSFQQSGFNQACCDGWPTEIGREALPSRPRPRPRPDTNGISEATLGKLTPKQEAFVREYLVDLNGTQAGIRAGYSEKSAPVIASQNLRKLNVLRAIEEAFMELGGVTRARIVDELGAIAFSDIGDFVDWDNRIEHVAADRNTRMDCSVQLEAGDKPADKVRVITNRVVLKPSHQLTREQRRVVAKVAQDRYGNVRMEMHDKLGALNSLARALGMFQDTTAHVEQPNPANLRATIIYEGRPGSTPGQLASPPVRRARDERA
jgi:phage terminase small subunit